MKRAPLQSRRWHMGALSGAPPRDGPGSPDLAATSARGAQHADMSRRRPRPLAQVLLRRVLAAYVSLALLVAGAQMFVEYRVAAMQIRESLESLAGTFAPGIESALWNLQAPLISSLARGIGANPDVIDVAIVDAGGQAVGEGWHAAGGLAPSARLTISRPLVHAGFDGAERIGTLTIASSEAILLRRLADKFWYVAISDAVLFVCLGLLLLLLMKATMARPLRRFSEQIAALSVGAREGEIDLGRVQVAEIDDLALAFNRLMNQLAASRAHVAIQNERLERDETQIKGIINSIPELIFIKDPQGVYQGCNAAFEAFVGRPQAEIVGRKDSDLFEASQAEVYRDHDQSLFANGLTHTAERRARYPDGREVTLETIKTALFSSDGTVVGLIGVSRDITERKKADALIWRQANFDFLTGLPNRHHFQELLAREIERARSASTPGSLLFIDLDHFKEINDSLGHHLGDMLLVQAAERIRQSLRSGDTLSRFGGDEFAVVLPELCDNSVISELALKIITRLSEPFLPAGQECFVSASVGVAIFPDDALDVADLVKRADQAMYAAKGAGRGRVAFFTKAMQDTSELRARIGRDLHRARRENQLELNYQPIVNMNSGEIRKVEALLRWKHPLLGDVSPANFIPIAEETGTIHEIGEWVAERAVQQLARWQSAVDPGFQVSINLSPVQILHGGRPQLSLIESLQRAGVGRGGVVIEITEGVLINKDADVAFTLRQFRDAGAQLAIDDFGTGYSALSYLRRFDIDYLKIDRSFVSNLTIEGHDLALCEAIVVMAHKLGIQVVAEGVETAQQQHLLRQIGCDFAQGFYFARPMRAESVEPFLREHAAKVRGE